MFRILGCLVLFVVSFLLMIVASTMAWDAFVNGKLYYCTDGGTLDFYSSEIGCITQSLLRTLFHAP